MIIFKHAFLSFLFLFQLLIPFSYAFGQDVLVEEPMNNSLDSCLEDTQYEALMSIYQAMDGDHWLVDEGWGRDCDYCQWYGIECNSENQITHLYLPSNGLKNSIPSSIIDLPHLKALVLDFNSITGPLPIEIASLSQLEFLVLDNNNVSGSIPSSLSKLQNLKWLELSDNMLTGSLPSSLGEITTLTQLSIKNNNIEGVIPASYGSLTSLISMDLSENQLEGCIPESFREFCDKDIILDENPCLSHKGDFSLFCEADSCDLSALPICIKCEDGIKGEGELGVDCGGACPPCKECHDVMDYESLMDLYNSTEGENWTVNTGWGEGCKICDWYGVECDSANRVTGIFLPFNNLKNSLPASLYQLTELETLMLDENDLSGHISSEIKNLSKLEFLLASNNSFSGNLPEELSELTNLRWILLNNNNFSGKLPSGLDNLASAEQILLANNALEGTLPLELVNIESLRNLHLNGNQFSGCIPEAYRNLCGRDVNLSDNDCLSHDGSFRDFCNGNVCTVPMKIGCGTCDDGIKNQDETDVDCGGTCQPCRVCPENDEYDALVSIYDSMGGAQWINNQGWLEDCDYCGWYGVDCDTSGHVLNLLLPFNGLKNAIPASIGKLLSLEGLILDENDISGTLPKEVGLLNNLKFLSVSNNRIEGNIPNELGHLSSLTWLLLSNNQFSGRIPESFSQLDNVNQLLLQSNILSGSIPASLSGLQNVQNMHLNDNELSGCIPAEFSLLCGKDVKLHDNPCLSHDADFRVFCEGNKECDIPKVIGCGTCSDGIQNQDETGVDCGGSCEIECPSCPESPDYEPLMALYNSTNGEGWINNEGWGDTCDVCTWYGVVCDTSGRVNNLFLPFNSLKGSIPASISELEYLEAIILDENQIDGHIPTEIGQLSKLKFLTLSKNSISGRLPEELGDLSNLLWLLLDHNSITDTLPDALGKLSNLDQFSLGNNQISGTLPSSFSNLLSIRNLSLNDNMISGCIPLSWDSFCGKNVNLRNNQCLSHEGEFSSFCLNNECDISSKDECGSCDDGVKNNGEEGIDCGGDCEPCKQCETTTDYEALMAFYNALNGPNWSNSSGWGEDCEICTWYGVECDSSDRVINVFLPFNGLSGSIPAEIGELTRLESLLLDFNRISGEIPPEIGNLLELQLLILTNNQISGPLPSELGNLTKLNWLLLNKNIFSGQIPEQIGNLTACTRLLLNDNAFEGNIPSSISNLTEAEIIRLDKNDLDGCIPESLISLCGRNVRLDQNECLSHNASFTAFCERPACNDYDICRCSDPNDERDILEEMYYSLNGHDWDVKEGWLVTCDHCDWSGVKCNDDGNIVELILKDNNLNGKLPNSIGSLTNISFLDLSNNAVTGHIPESMAPMTSLRFLRLNNNDIYGEIPDIFSNMKSLWDLRLNNNELTGEIPTSLGEATSLFNLHLFENNLSGHIPDNIGDLNKIFQLYLQWNDLEGCIPTSIKELCGAKINVSNNPCLSHEGDIDLFCSDIECDLTNLVGCPSDTLATVDSLVSLTRETLTGSRSKDVVNAVGYSDLFRAFPNPVAEVLYVESYTTKSTSTAILTDVAGKVMWEGTIMSSVSIDMTSLASGMYLLRIQNQDDSHLEKIVKR